MRNAFICELLQKFIKPSLSIWQPTNFTCFKKTINNLLKRITITKSSIFLVRSHFWIWILVLNYENKKGYIIWQYCHLLVTIINKKLCGQSIVYPDVFYTFKVGANLLLLCKLEKGIGGQESVLSSNHGHGGPLLIFHFTNKHVPDWLFIHL